jgi:hypothetical protein
MKYNRALAILALILIITSYFKPDILFSNITFSTSRLIVLLIIICTIEIFFILKYKMPDFIYRFYRRHRYQRIRYRLMRIVEHEDPYITLNQINEILIQISLEDLRSRNPQRKNIGLMTLYNLGQDAPYEIQDQIYKGLIRSLETEPDKLFIDTLLETLCWYRKHRKAI